MAEKRNLPKELFDILNPLLPFFALIQDYKQDETAIRIAFDGILFGFITDKMKLPKEDIQGKALIKTAIVDALELAFEGKIDKEKAKAIFLYYKDRRNIIGKAFFDQMMVNNSKKQKEFEANATSNTHVN